LLTAAQLAIVFPFRSSIPSDILPSEPKVCVQHPLPASELRFNYVPVLVTSSKQSMGKQGHGGQIVWVSDDGQLTWPQPQ